MWQTIPKRRSATSLLNRLLIFLILSKRKKFLLIAFILSCGLIYSQKIPLNFRYYYILGASVLTLLLTQWSLREDLKKIGWLIVPILPTLYTAGVYLFYFLLPEELLIQLILFVLFCVGMYALLLTENIYSVAALRTIQLLRAAHALGFVFSLITAFLLFDTIFSFRLHPWFNSSLVFITSLAIGLQAMWSAKLVENLEKKALSYSLVLAWCLGELAFLISLWPVTIVIASLFLVTAMYVILGVTQQALLGRLFQQTVREYIQVGVLVFIIVFLATKWGG